METYVSFLGLLVLTDLAVLVIAATGFALFGMWRAVKDTL